MPSAGIPLTYILGLRIGRATARCDISSKEENVMPTFMVFINWTEQGVKNAKDASKRNQAAKATAEKLGGRLLSTYVTTGQYDVVATLDMPSGDAMVKFVTAVGASGSARTTTVRAFTPEEFSKIVADAPSFGGK
jgi:uncharacterized protein with GYD domain